ncbi:MAG: High confidence in function and specificity [Pseudomonadota bacterium]|jgi:chromosome segregation protein
MHIKKLEICGFKSFVDKTVVHFDHDVIGIVGPNGCGKSNIVDAIRWCMGEQSAKHLRGRAMEDVIFSGSDSRAAAGLAEVTLTFDNNDSAYAESLPEEYRQYPEIAVTRRLFRDGTSEYLVNKTQVRLRDVTDLFLGTGVGTKAYSIVEQGRIGQIVSSRPQDRRLYIEEAAGITKYRLRRKQAAHKMDLTRQNLLRITDIVSEIDRTRGSLKRQAAKAERFISYRGELEDLFLHDASHRLLELIVVNRVHAQTLETQEARSTEVGVQIAESEARLNAAREEASSIESRYDAATSAAVAAEQRVSQLTSDFERARDRRVHLSDRLDASRVEKADLEVKLATLAAEAAELDARISLLSKDEESRNTDAAEEQRQLDELRAAENQATQQVQDLRAKAAAERTEQATTSTRISSITQQLEDSTVRRARLEQERCQLATEIERLKLSHQALLAVVAEFKQAQASTLDESELLQTDLAALKPQQEQLSKELSELQRESQQKQSRLKALQELHQRLEGVGAGTKALLSSADPVVLGMLADRVEVEDEYTDALAGLMGEWLQTVIVKDPARGLQLLEELKTNRRGRATIAFQRPAYVAGQNSQAEGDTRVLGQLIDHLRYAPEDEALVRSLVGDAVVVRNAQHAFEVNAQYSGVIAVALDGTVVGEHGLVSGGSGDNVAAAMVEQKREIGQLVATVEGLNADCAAAKQRHEELKLRIEQVQQDLVVARQSKHERELKLLTAEKDFGAAKLDLGRQQERYDRVSEERSELDKKLGAMGETLEADQLRLLQLSDSQAELASALEAAELEASSWKERTAAQGVAVTERKVRLAQVREQLEASRASFTRVEGSSNEAATRIERLASDMTQSAMTLGEVAAQLLTTKEAQGEAALIAQTAQRSLDEVRRLLDQVRSGLGQCEGELRELRVELAELNEQVSDAQMNLQRLRLEREHLVRGVAEKFRGLDLPRVVGDYHARPAPDAEHRRRIDELTKLIDRMGPVNLDAKTEYEDAERRFVELNDQKVDIDSALIELERAIKHMDRESKRRFRETFDTVNELFKATFVRLFKGGTAALTLTDPENILETGVDIMAQPPGKKLGNIELMSGGEKALTATALIFAIFQHRPSPFCILDEVDAPLDEANVSRYNEAIRAMTASSQFVVITHIKQTMQSVDVLYGVTMGEPGVSRMVSVKVNEKAGARSSRIPSALDMPKRSADEPVELFTQESAASA